MDIGFVLMINLEYDILDKSRREQWGNVTVKKSILKNPNCDYIT